jgi:uncharacterized protein
MKKEKVFIDTSAFYALLDRDDLYHPSAKTLWPSLLENSISLVTSNYVVSEAMALIQYRLGFDAAALWYKDVLGVLDVCWVDQATHRRAYQLWLGLGRRRCSLVECTSYVIMHQNHIEKVFSFKRNFAEHGFQLLTQAATSELLSQ